MPILLVHWSTDPYVTVTFSKQNKPLYSTRIIRRELNPIFEESAILLVDANAIKIRERLRIQLWDSDRGSAVCYPGYTRIKNFIRGLIDTFPG